ncbi:MAG: hypothetical protein WED10_15485 [Brumimicrobium sp.]
MKTIFSIALIFSLSLANASDISEVMEKMRTVYKSKTLSFNSTYSLFKGHFNNEIHSSYTGKVYKDEEGTYQRIENTEFIYGKEFTLKISHDEKAMVISNAQEVLFGNVDFEMAMKECRSKKIIEKEGEYHIIFHMNATSLVPFTTLTLKIDQSNYTLLQLDLYYSAQEDFSKKFEMRDLKQPHLQIKFSDINFNPNKKDELLQQSSYLTTTNSVLTTTGKYEGYELIDYRNKQ